MELITFSLKIASSLALGIMVGLERQWRGHPAGLRTNALVCLGATLFVSISTLKKDDDSKTRIASYIVSGIGFLGGGVILREGFNIRGMNTAATLWCTAAVGTLCGVNYPLHALFGTACILGIHFFIRPFAHWIDRQRKSAINVEQTYQLRVVCQEAKQERIRSALFEIIGAFPKMMLQGISLEEKLGGGEVEILADVFSLERNDRAMEEIVWRLDLEKGVEALSWKKVE